MSRRPGFQRVLVMRTDFRPRSPSARTVAAACALLTTLALAAGSRAENLFPRGEFDQAADATGWGNPQGVGSFAYAPLADADACVLSGAATETADDIFGGTTYSTSLCAGAINGGQSYRLGYRARFPTQSGAGTFEMKVGWFPGPDCTSLTVLISTVPPVASTPADLWQSASVVANPPANAVSFAVAVFLHKSTTAPLQVEIDGLYVRPASEIFIDRFEIGESCRWTLQDQP